MVLYLGDICCVGHPEVTMCNWPDVKIQKLLNYVIAVWKWLWISSGNSAVRFFRMLCSLTPAQVWWCQTPEPFRVFKMVTSHPCCCAFLPGTALLTLPWCASLPWPSPLLLCAFTRYGLPDFALTREFDVSLTLKMSSVRYVHTNRFQSELVAFCQHFLQLQDVLGRMRAASAGQKVPLHPPTPASFLPCVRADFAAHLDTT